MIKHEATGMSITVYTGDNFWIDFGDVGNFGVNIAREAAFTRQQLTDLRATIDQALNTSSEELEAPGE